MSGEWVWPVATLPVLEITDTHTYPDNQSHTHSIVNTRPCSLEINRAFIHICIELNLSYDSLTSRQVPLKN